MSPESLLYMQVFIFLLKYFHENPNFTKDQKLFIFDTILPLQKHQNLYPLIRSFLKNKFDIELPSSFN